MQVTNNVCTSNDFRKHILSDAQQSHIVSFWLLTVALLLHYRLDYLATL